MSVFGSQPISDEYHRHRLSSAQVSCLIVIALRNLSPWSAGDLGVQCAQVDILL